MVGIGRAARAGDRSLSSTRLAERYAVDSDLVVWGLPLALQVGQPLTSSRKAIQSRTRARSKEVRPSALMVIMRVPRS